MGSTRAKGTIFPLILAMIFGIVLVCSLSTPALASSQASPSPEVDLICHTSDANDCYPRLFEPTDEFQTVHDDQDLPSGLHVRLNIYTGKKEAKINVPGEEDPALEGLPVDQAVLIVDPEQPDAPHIPKGAPAYEPVGKIKEPPPHEATSFADAIALLKSGISRRDGDYDQALEVLEDISHDMYYGLKIAEDNSALKTLFCMMVSRDAKDAVGVTPRDQQAAHIIAGMLQNNPAALKEVASTWKAIMRSECPQGGPPMSELFYESFVPHDRFDADQAKAAANKVKAKVSAINGLIKDDHIRAEWLKNGGMTRLLEVMVPGRAEWATAQRKAGQLVLDSFLDEDMGAKLGQWPLVPKTEGKQCQQTPLPEEGCWDYHVERIMKVNKGDKGHWSKDLHDRLAAVRKTETQAPKHEEL